MKRLMTIVGAIALMCVVAAIPAEAKTLGTNGQIAFTGYDSATGEPHTFIGNPDGTHRQELSLPFPGDNPTWSPGGSKLFVNVFRPDAPVRPATVNPDGSSFTVLDVPELPGDTDMACRAWSPDGTKLLCEVTNFFGHTELDGVYTIRSSDGGGLTRLTTNPYPPEGEFGGGDIPGDYSPDGSQFVFMRAKPGAGPVPDRSQSGALFIENSDGTGLHQITPYGLANSHDNGVARWSPNGSEILFAGIHERFNGGSLYVVHTDGTGLRSIPLKTGGSFSLAFTPGWSPDGTKMIFSLFTAKGPRIGDEGIYTANADGSGLFQVTSGFGFDFADWGTHPLIP